MDKVKDEIFKASAFDITVVQKGEIYIVSGKDAAMLHAKMTALPPESRRLEIGELNGDSFTLKKIAQDKLSKAG